MSTDFISTVSIFAELNESELSELNKLYSMRQYPKGSMVIGCKKCSN